MAATSARARTGSHRLWPQRFEIETVAVGIVLIYLAEFSVFDLLVAQREADNENAPGLAARGATNSVDRKASIYFATYGLSAVLAAHRSQATETEDHEQRSARLGDDRE